MKKTYIITQDVNSPLVVGNQTAHRPAQVRYKRFRRGQQVQGELKHADNKPAFILVGRMFVIPIECVKELHAKDIVSKFSGSDMDEKPKTIKADALKPATNPKVQYLDAFLIGGVAGFLLTHLAVKKGYLTTEDPKARIYGAVAGSVLGLYLVYRAQNNKTLKSKEQ